MTHLVLIFVDSSYDHAMFTRNNSNSRPRPRKPKAATSIKRQSVPRSKKRRGVPSISIKHQSVPRSRRASTKKTEGGKTVVHKSKRIEPPASSGGICSYLTAMGYTKKDQFAQTPLYIYKPLHKEFHFTFDPAPIAPKFDGLTVSWKARNYVNPPYNDISSWIRKALVELELGKSSVFLIPFRPHTSYWQQIMKKAKEIRFFRKRVKFNGYETPAPFAVVVVVFQPKSNRSFSNFRVVDLVKETGGRTIPLVLAYYKRTYPFTHIVTSFDGNITGKWGKFTFICSTVQVLPLITRAEEEAKAGNVVVLVIPMRTEASYFIDRILFGKAQAVEALYPALICEGFDTPAPTGSVALVFTPGSRPRFAGPKLTIQEDSTPVT